MYKSIKNLNKRGFWLILPLIYIFEIAIHYVLMAFDTLDPIVETILDSTILTILIGPFFYQIFVKSLVLKNKQLLIDYNRQKEGLDLVALISETDNTGRITFANDNFCRVSGYDRKELIGHHHNIINSGYHPPEFWADVWQTISKGKIWKGDICNKAKDGSLYWVGSTIFPKLDTLGNVIGYSAVRINITERIKINTELKHIALEAKKVADAKSIFLANMSHEIRTPLNGILGMAQILNETNLNEEQKKFLKVIISSGNSLLVILNDILDFSKLEFDKVEIEHIKFDLRFELDSLVKLFENVAFEKKVILNLKVQESLPNILIGDITRIRQILSNFLSNGIKFSYVKGNVDIEVMSEDINENEIMIVFSVKDNGIGVKKDDLSKLFKAFGQADVSTTRKYGGTGLGLAISSKLATLMHGEISFESDFGIGSKLTLKLPLKIGTNDAASNGPKEKISDKVSIDNHFSHLPVLIVDDSEMNITIVKLMLKKMNITCDFALNGKEALDLLTKNGSTYYQLIFMDMQMPIMDGIETTKLIIEKFGGNRPPIVAMTANVFKEDMELCLKTGMVDFIPKPVEKKTLVEIIEKYFHKAA